MSRSPRRSTRRCSRRTRDSGAATGMTPGSKSPGPDAPGGRPRRTRHRASCTPGPRGLGDPRAGARQARPQPARHAPHAADRGYAGGSRCRRGRGHATRRRGGPAAASVGCRVASAQGSVGERDSRTAIDGRSARDSFRADAADPADQVTQRAAARTCMDTGAVPGASQRMSRNPHVCGGGQDATSVDSHAFCSHTAKASLKQKSPDFTEPEGRLQSTNDG